MVLFSLDFLTPGVNDSGIAFPCMTLFFIHKIQCLYVYHVSHVYNECYKSGHL